MEPAALFSRRARVVTRALFIALAFALESCAATLSPEPAEPSAATASVPSVPAGRSPNADESAADGLPEDAILLRAGSGPWESADERRRRAPAEVVLYRDGTVLANVSPVLDVRDVRAIRLDPEEVDDLLKRVADAAPEPVDLASSVNSGCFDAGAQVIQVRSGGRPIELAVYCLDTRLSVVLDGTPESAVTLSRILDHLQRLAVERPAITSARAMPLVPVAPHTGG